MKESEQYASYHQGLPGINLPVQRPLILGMQTGFTELRASA